MSFSLDLKAFAEKAEANAETVIKKVAIDLFSVVIDRSPVGNPELWAANSVAVQYNSEMARLNAELRNDPANLSKNGRMKPSRLINDGMDLVAGGDYVGGRFRGNWQVSFDAAKTGTLERIDPSSNETLNDGATVIQGFTTQVGTIWIMNTPRRLNRWSTAIRAKRLPAWSASPSSKCRCSSPKPSRSFFNV
jgi:hypothetical protein